MEEQQVWHEADEAESYALPAADADPLGVLGSTRRVVEDGEHVWINRERLGQLGVRWPTLVGSAAPADYERYHFFDGSERSANWILLLDSVNFCFWAEKNQPRWGITYRGERLNGYWALAAALTRAVEEGKPLWDAEYLSNMSATELAWILRDEQALSIPLFDSRLAHIREVGRVLLERFGGQFTQAIAQAAGSAPRLVQLLVEAFPSFRDIATYRQREVRFLKRAQICVADLHTFFRGAGWGAFYDLDRLTVFADYKLPQILRHFGVLEYCPALAERIDNQELIAAGSEEEIELRAATIWACELLRRALQAQGIQLSAVEIDQQLWLLSQRIPDMRPYHRTRTVYY
jgi:hypothetical protein